MAAKEPLSREGTKKKGTTLRSIAIRAVKKLVGLAPSMIFDARLPPPMRRPMMGKSKSRPVNILSQRSNSFLVLGRRKQTMARGERTVRRTTPA